MIKYLLAIGWLILSISTYGQNKQTIFFTETTYNYGLIPEENGVVKHTFTFTNNGKEPLEISGVNASCGCTTSGFSKDIIPPGGNGFVEVIFDPYNRPGAFKKSLTVTSNGDPSVVTLYIEGTVKPKPKSVAEEYPKKIGALRLKFTTLNMGHVKNNARTSRNFEVYNDSDQSVKIEKIADVPKHLNITFQPQELQPKTSGNIVVDIDPTKLELGHIVETISIQTNEPNPDNNKELRITAVIEEYFSPMTSTELAKAPRISVDRRQYDFGSAAAGAQVNATFTLTNTGKEKLHIRKIQSHCDCVTIELDKDVLKRHEQAIVRAKFNTSGRQGNQLVSITIFTDDPQESMKVVRIKGRVN